MSAADESWFVIDGVYERRRILIRGREHLDRDIDRASYLVLVRVVLSYEPDKKTGLPDGETNWELGELENAVLDAFEKDQLCVFFCMHTYDGDRKWLGYSRDGQAARERIESCLEGQDLFPVSIIIEDDPDWEEYQRMLEGTGMDRQ